MISSINTKKVYNQSLLPQRTKIAFGAGVTHLYSDFDGTYMPAQYSHDSICKSKPPINKNAFQLYFDKFNQFIQKASGKPDESKFKFSITTGRNLPEFNYYIKKNKRTRSNSPLT